MDLIDYLKDAYAPSRVNLGDKTLRQMEIAFGQLNGFAGKNLKVSDLSEALILKWMKWMLKNGMSPTVVNVRRGYARAVWKHAYRKRKNRHNFYESDIPKAAELNDTPIAWSLDQLNVMLESARAFRERKLPFPGKCWMALILLIYYTGLRIGVTLSLKRSCLRGRMLIVPAKDQKDKEGLAVRLPDSLVNLLHSLPRPHDRRNGRLLSEFLIPWPWSLKNPQRIFAKYILEPAGLPIDRKLKFHAIRKTVATVVSATSGMEAAKSVMGHSSIKVTERYVAPHEMVDPRLKGRLAPMDVMPPLSSTG